MGNGRSNRSLTPLGAALGLLSLVAVLAAPAAFAERVDNGWRVRPGDSLSRIVSKLLPDKPAARRQLMTDLVKANPRAFAKGDPNRMFAGVTLVIPGAQAPVATERQHRAARPVDLTPPAPREYTMAPEARLGKVEFAKGAVTGQVATEEVRFLGKDSDLYLGDVVNTGRRSFAILRLEDGSRLTLRPNTVFQVEEYATADQQERATLRLFRGGLRNVTGFISKRERGNYRLRTPFATIGIRGTEFDARLCRGDCASEVAQNRDSPFRPAGRVAYTRGRVTAAGGGKAARALATGAPVYAGEYIETGAGSWVVLAFRDRGRITLRPNTRFQIVQYVYELDKTDTGRSIFSLLRGGLRAVTGIIGKGRRGSYQVHTPVATIGIRGTGYDAQCRGSCATLDAQAADPTTQDGAFFQVFHGEGIDLIQGETRTPVDLNQAVFIPGPLVAPVSVAGIPADLVSDDAPRPDQIEIDDKLFQESREGQDGLQLALYDGELDVASGDGELIPLDAGEALAIGEGGQGTPVAQPRFLLEDPYLSAGDLNLSSLNTFDLVPGGAQPPGESLQCGL